MASQAWNPLGPCPAPPSTSLSGGSPRSGPRFSSCLFLLLLARNFCLCPGLWGHLAYTLLF